jgi:hypothetical protein
MSEFSVEYIGNSPGDMENKLSSLGSVARKRSAVALRETAEKVKADLEKTSPVDSGQYQSSWYIQPIDQDEIWILNEADHAKFVMLPNTKMIGSNKADLPAQGILHNVKGVARKHSDTNRENLVEQLRDMFDTFSKRGN